jgi:hypothetical protein
MACASRRFRSPPSRSSTGRLRADRVAPHRFAVNYLAPLLVRCAPSRIVNVASAGQAAIDFDDVMLERGYRAQADCQSKLALVMLAFDLADARRRLRGSQLSWWTKSRFESRRPDDKEPCQMRCFAPRVNAPVAGPPLSTEAA